MLIRCIFFKLINVKMPMTVKMQKIVGILIFMSRINFMLNLVEHKKDSNLGTWKCSYHIQESIYDTKSKANMTASKLRRNQQAKHVSNSFLLTYKEETKRL